MRRCIDSSVIKSDRFRDMPLSSQMLYIHLILEADNYGFLNNTKSTAENIGASSEDLDNLIQKGFLLHFPSEVFCITHWFMMNRQDKRLVPTFGEFELVKIKNNKYEFRNDGDYPIDPEMEYHYISNNKGWE